MLKFQLGKCKISFFYLKNISKTFRTLSPTDICKACTYKTKNDKQYKNPDFRSEYNCGKSYVPSYNIAPTDVTPVLVSASHFDDESLSSDRVLVPMMWSMIPFWHKVFVNSCLKS